MYPQVPDNIQAKPDVKAYPKVTGNLNKLKVERDQCIAIATYQKILSLLLVLYKVCADPVELLKHQEANLFVFLALLQSTAGGTAAIKVKRFQAT